MNANYRERLKDKKRIVIKIGSSSLIHSETGRLDFRKLEILARELEIPETEVTLKGADSNILKEETRQVRDNA